MVFYELVVYFEINTINTDECMQLANITCGKNPPKEVNVIIEITADAGPIKYEFDKDTACIMVDRIMVPAFSYPCNYGFIPHTLSGDGDPIDVLVYASAPIMAGAVIAVRPIGVLVTEDEKGMDEKILAVPLAKVDPMLKDITSIENAPAMLLRKIEHFFTHYKALEEGKWVKVKGWQGHEVAEQLISQAINNG